MRNIKMNKKEQLNNMLNDDDSIFVTIKLPKMVINNYEINKEHLALIGLNTISDYINSVLKENNSNCNKKRESLKSKEILKLTKRTVSELESIRLRINKANKVSQDYYNSMNEIEMVYAFEQWRKDMLDGLQFKRAIDCLNDISHSNKVIINTYCD